MGRMSTQTLKGLQNLIRRSHSARLYQEVGKALLCNRSALVRTGPGDKQLIVPPDVLRVAHVGAHHTNRAQHGRTLLPRWSSESSQVNEKTWPWVRLQNYPRATQEELLIWRTRQPQMNITNTLSWGKDQLPATAQTAGFSAHSWPPLSPTLKPVTRREKTYMRPS